MLLRPSCTCCHTFLASKDCILSNRELARFTLLLGDRVLTMLPWLDWNLLYGAGWLQTGSNSPASTSPKLGLQECATIPDPVKHFITAGAWWEAIFVLFVCPYAFVGQRSGFVSSSPLWVPRIRFRSSDLHGMSHLYSHAICIRRHTNLYYSNPHFCKRYWNCACLKISKCMNQSSQNAHFNSLGQEVAGEGEWRSKIKASELQPAEFISFKTQGKEKG